MPYISMFQYLKGAYKDGDSFLQGLAWKRWGLMVTCYSWGDSNFCDHSMNSLEEKELQKAGCSDLGDVCSSLIALLTGQNCALFRKTMLSVILAQHDCKRLWPRVVFILTAVFPWILVGKELLCNVGIWCIRRGIFLSYGDFTGCSWSSNVFWSSFSLGSTHGK